MNFIERLEQHDPEISQACREEGKRQQNQIELIASENFTSLAVMAAQGSVMTNKYAEGYPGRRYYGGCEFVDQAENLAIRRAQKLFGANYINVQPHSGSQANEAVFLALLNPGDKIMGMALDAGGHLTHGSKVNFSGKWFQPVFYGVDAQTGVIDMDEVERVAHAEKPKLIIAGGSSYPRKIDFAHFRHIADSIGAYLMVDMAHFSGLVAGGVFPSPVPHAHVVTTTTHKTLRGPRGGMILWNDESLKKKINSAVFPGNQGGPLMHVIAAKAVCFREALREEYRLYVKQVIKNAQALADVLIEKGVNVLTGGTDCHLLLMNVTEFQVNGTEAQIALEAAGITCNKNTLPNDPLPPSKTSGIRVGSPAMTTRGFQEKEFRQIGVWIYEILKSVQGGEKDKVIAQTSQGVFELCQEFPLYPELNLTEA